MTERVKITVTSEQQWLEERAKNVSSTESSALYGLSKYITAFELWHQKKAGGVVHIEDNERMAAGRALEPVIASLASERIGITAWPFKDYMVIPHARMGSSFDYRLDDGSLLEIKNVDGLVYRREWSDTEAPDHIEVQVQHQMHVADIDVCYIAALVGGNELKIIKRERNPKVGASLEKKIIRFWESIESGHAPEPEWERDAKFVMQLSANAGGDAIEADESIEEMIEQYRAHKQIADEQSKKADEFKARIMDAIGDADAVIGDGWKLTTSRTKDTDPKILHITEDMVGTDYEISKGRKGYRQFRLNIKKGAK